MNGAALRAMADFVDTHATVTAWDLHYRPTPEQEAVKAEKIRTVARELRALADAAETRKLRFGEYQALKDRLYAFGLALTPRLEQDVAAAFYDAEGPAKPRDRGWFRQP